MHIKKLLDNDPVHRYRYILELWKLAKLKRWAAIHPFFSRWVKLALDVPPEDNDGIIIPVQEVIRAQKALYCLIKS